MESKSWLKTSPLERLKTDPRSFSFYQAIRLIGYSSRRHFVGTDTSPFQEALRLKNNVSLSFPACEVISLKTQTLKQGLSKRTQFILEAAVMGLAGVPGPLPQHYTELILEQGRLGDKTLKDFLALFDHRFLSFFYRAWAKNKIFMGYERASCGHAKKDWSAIALQSLHGNSIFSVYPSFSILSKIGVFCSGLLAQQPRSAEGLRQVLSLYLSFPVQIFPFEGMWLRLPNGSRTSLKKICGYNQLGHSSLLGEKVWSQDNRFTLLIGPLNFQTFQKFLSQDFLFKSLKEIIDHYVNNNLEYSIRLALKAEDVPRCQLRIKATCQLGWNTWLLTKPALKDREDTVLKGKNLLKGMKESIRNG